MNNYTLKELIQNNCSCPSKQCERCNNTRLVMLAVKEWLVQKRQEVKASSITYGECRAIDELLEELPK